jgi:hypothetical protein
MATETKQREFPPIAVGVVFGEGAKDGFAVTNVEPRDLYAVSERWGGDYWFGADDDPYREWCLTSLTPDEVGDLWDGIPDIHKNTGMNHALIRYHLYERVGFFDYQYQGWIRFSEHGYE